MKKNHKRLLWSVIFFLMIAETSFAGETKLVNVTIDGEIKNGTVIGGHRIKNNDELEKSLTIERGEGNNIKPWLGMVLERGDRITLKEGRSFVIERNRKSIGLFTAKACLKITAGGYHLIKGAGFFETVKEDLFSVGTEWVKASHKGTVYYIAVQDNEKAQIGIFPQVGIDIRDQKITVTDKFGDHTLTVNDMIPNTYRNYMSEEVYRDRFESYGGGNILKDYGSLKPIIGNHFGYSRVPIRNAYPSGVAATLIDYKRSMVKIPGEVSVDSRNDGIDCKENEDFCRVNLYRNKAREIVQWRESVKQALPYVFTGFPDIKLPTSNNVVPRENNSIEEPSSDSGDHTSVMSTFRKLTIASILIGEAASKPQSAIIRSRNGQPKSAFRNMKLKDGDQIMTRDASLILEADNGKLFYLLRNQTHVQLKQGRLYLISGNAYYSDSADAKIYAAEQWVSMTR